MGGTHTKIDQEEHLEDMCTPPRQNTKTRMLEFDPRSPSTEITRTPILVDKTPECLLDPRSPTPGVVRTPIPEYHGTDAFLSDINIFYFKFFYVYSIFTSFSSNFLLCVIGCHCTHIYLFVTAPACEYYDCSFLSASPPRFFCKNTDDKPVPKKHKCLVDTKMFWKDFLRINF